MLDWLLSHFYIKMLLTGVALSIFIALKRKERFGFGKREICENILLCTVTGFVGAKLMFLLENPGLELRLSGLSFFGSVFFMPVFMRMIMTLRKKKYAAVMDFLAPYIPLALAFVRIGCWYKGCCGTDIYLQKEMIITLPIQPVEAFLDLCIMWYLFQREHEEHKEGSAYPVFLALYGIVRLFTEIYRVEPRNSLGLSNGQLCALIAIAVGGILLYEMEHNNAIRRICRVPKGASVGRNVKKKRKK